MRALHICWLLILIGVCACSDSRADEAEAEANEAQSEDADGEDRDRTVEESSQGDERTQGAGEESGLDAGGGSDGDRGAQPSGGASRTDDVPPDVVLDGSVLPDGGPLLTGELRINEVDCAGDRMELINTGANTLDLAGFSVSDRVDEMLHSQPLSGSVAPGAYHVLMLDGFGIRCGEENAVLFRDHEIVDLVPPARTPGGASWGRLPDGTGSFAATAPTLGAANRPFVDESAALFSPLESSVEVDITLSAQSRAALVADPRTYVEGTLTLEAAGKQLGPLRVGVRLKGSEGSFQDLDGKAAFKISLDELVKGQRAFGQEKLTLNNFKQDNTAMHEWLAYRIFSAVGVPAPRVGYAHVTLNGSDYGTYLLVETPDEKDFLARNFPSTFATYEPVPGQDLTPEHVPMLEVDTGDGVDRSFVLAVAEGLRAAPIGGVYEAMKARIDYPEVLREMAVELFTGEWDGYAISKNNYVIHIDERGVFRLMPWGADQTFASRESMFGGSGILLTTCLSDLSCIQLWLDALKDVRSKVRALLDAGIVDEARRLAALNAMRFRTDPRVNWDTSGVEARGQALIAELPGRLDSLIADLDCQSSKPDGDGDGRRCQLDCDDGNRARYYGAPDLCGDQIDQDCSGIWDDGPDCPACVADSALAGYLFCPRVATRDAADSACTAAGAHLTSIGSQAQNEALARRAALWFSDRSFWTGLRAAANSSSFAWSDGSPLSYTAYAAGEPAGDASQPRCVTMRGGGGRWTAENCYRRLPFTCEQ